MLSSLRRDRLLAAFSELKLPVADITAQFEHYVSVSAPLSDEQHDLLTRLLTYGEPDSSPEASAHADNALRFSPFGYGIAVGQQSK